jgi:hypothetical protein
MFVILLLLPEAYGRILAPLETAAAGDRSLSHAGFDDFRDGPSCVIVPERVPATFREWRRPTG